MSRAPKSVLKVSKSLLELAHLEAKDGRHLDSIMILQSIQRDAEKCLSVSSESAEADPYVGELGDLVKEVIRLQSKFREEALNFYMKQPNLENMVGLV